MIPLLKTNARGCVKEKPARSISHSARCDQHLNDRRLFAVLCGFVISCCWSYSTRYLAWWRFLLSDICQILEIAGENERLLIDRLQAWRGILPNTEDTKAPLGAKNIARGGRNVKQAGTMRNGRTRAVSRSQQDGSRNNFGCKQRTEADRRARKSR